jgi:hypothetical protein
MSEPTSISRKSGNSRAAAEYGLRRLLIALGTLALALAVISTVRAQSGGGLDLSWSTVDGGGGASESNGLRLTGTAGQPDADVLTGDGYKLEGGFWGGGGAEEDVRIYLPLTLRGQ